MSLDLTPGRGNLLGESYWEMTSPWLGGSSMLNYVVHHIIELMCRMKLWEAFVQIARNYEKYMLKYCT